jgi:hypothetical protein
MTTQLLEALYMPGMALPNDESYYKQLLRDQDFDSIAPQVYYLLKERDKLGGIPDFFYLYLKKQYLQTLQLNLFVKHQTNLLLNQFEDNEIEVVPLKGVVFAETHFGNLGARRTSDIDLLIKEQNLEEAVKMVKNLGFTTEEERIPGHFHCSYSKQLPGSEIPLVVELHWDLLKESTADFNIEEFWQAANPQKESDYIKELTDLHSFYMIVLHGWRHNLDSLKYFLDIIHLIYCLKEKLDFDLLIGIAEKHKTRKRVIRTLTAVHQEYPFLDRIKHFPYKSGKRYLTLGNKKEGSNLYKKYADYIEFQYFSYDTSSHILKEVLETLLPGKK